jgi:hypothetical protein
MIAKIQSLIDRIFKLEQINGGERCPTYLYRWTLLSIPKRLGVYVHHFVGDDWSRDLHDHPKRFVSIGLAGQYVEETPDPASLDPEAKRERVFRAPWIRTFPADHIHRVRMIGRGTCWTLVLVFRPVREWGFWHLGEWIQWREYVKGSRKSIADMMKNCPD